MSASRREFLGIATATAAGILLACTPVTPARQVATDLARSPDRSARPTDLWNGSGIDAKVLFQQEVDELPEAPHMLRVTELEMAPGASIDPHTHLGPGAQVVLSGAFTVVDVQSSAATVYESTTAKLFPVYYTGRAWRYSTENRAAAGNRLFMTEILSQSRGFLGNQQFESEGGVHNQGGVRSGPYLQIPLQRLPDQPLIVRVTQIDLGPKGKSPEYTRPGPGLFYVVSGQATFRRQADLFITTNGAGGYFFDDGAEPIILENKPITPARLIAVEFLPAALGKQPSTVPTGREL